MPFVRPRPLAALAVVGAAVAIAGCGGGDDSGGALSADEFRTQADAICADANTRLEALDEPTGNDQVLGFLQSGLAVQQEQLDKLKALEPPNDLAGTFNEAMDLLDQQTSEIQGATDRISGGEDPQTVVSDVSPKLDSISAQADAKAKELGLTVCGTEDTATGAGTTATTATVPPATVTAAGHDDLHLPVVGDDGRHRRLRPGRPGGRGGADDVRHRPAEHHQPRRPEGEGAGRHRGARRSSTRRSPSSRPTRWPTRRSTSSAPAWCGRARR